MSPEDYKIIIKNINSQLEDLFCSIEKNLQMNFKDVEASYWSNYDEGIRLEFSNILWISLKGDDIDKIEPLREIFPFLTLSSIDKIITVHIPNLIKELEKCKN